MSTQAAIDRRTWLRGVAATASACFLTPASWAGAPPTRSAPRLSPAEFQSQLRGAVMSIPTCFEANLDVDYAGFRQMIERAKPHGIRVFTLTAGNSQYDVLTRGEIKNLTRLMIEAAGKECLTIAAAGDWDLNDTLDYAELAQQEGASALQVMKPADRGEEATLQYFRQVAQRTPLPLVLHGEFSLAELEQLVAVPSIVALKEDVGPAYLIDTQRKFGDRLAIFEGGPEYIYLIGYPYGAPASYTTLGTFAPQLTARFWQALQEKNLLAAYELVRRYEHPFFDRWSHAFWRATLEHFGVAQRYLRPPQQALTAAAMDGVAEFYQQLGLAGAA